MLSLFVESRAVCLCSNLCPRSIMASAAITDSSQSRRHCGLPASCLSQYSTRWSLFCFLLMPVTWHKFWLDQVVDMWYQDVNSEPNQSNIADDGKMMTSSTEAFIHQCSSTELMTTRHWIANIGSHYSSMWDITHVVWQTLYHSCFLAIFQMLSFICWCTISWWLSNAWRSVSLVLKYEEEQYLLDNLLRSAVLRVNCGDSLMYSSTRDVMKK